MLRLLPPTPFVESEILLMSLKSILFHIMHVHFMSICNRGRVCSVRFSDLHISVLNSVCVGGVSQTCLIVNLTVSHLIAFLLSYFLSSM